MRRPAFSIRLNLPRNGIRCGVVVVLLTHAALLAFSGWLRSPVYDEYAHLAAGISHWTDGNFELFRANPPLTRMVGSLAVLAAGVEQGWLVYADGPGVRAEFDAGHSFLVAHGERCFRLFVIGRWACIPISLLGGYFCYRWASALYGPSAGLVAVALWCCSPDVLTHAAHITPDAAAAAFGLAAGFFFWSWLRRPTRQNTVVAGMALGIALLTKLTWLVLFGLWPALWLVDRLIRRQRGSLAEAKQLACTLLLGLFVLNLAYAFQGTFRPLDSYEFVSQSLGGPSSERDGRGGNRFAGGLAGKVPVPLPADYVLGIDLVKEAFEMNRLAYLGGEFSNGGWWYYYMYAIAVKVPLGTGVLVLLSIVAGWRMRHGGCAADTVTVSSVPLVLVVLASFNSGLNEHLRYLLPAFPFVFVYGSRWTIAFASRWPLVAATGSLGLIWSTASSLAVYPHSTAYFNELAGGPANGHSHLISSNIDWGQDLLNLKRWLDRHPNVRPLTLAYFGPTDPRVAGIEFDGLPPHVADGANHWEQGQGPQAGWHAVSVHILRGSPTTVHDSDGRRRRIGFGWYHYFLETRPVASIGYSINVYHISEAEADRLRARLGLEPLTGSASARDIGVGR